MLDHELIWTASMEEGTVKHARSISLLVGAGFSKEAGLPTAAELTREIVEDLREDRLCQPHTLRALTTVIGGIQLKNAHDQMDPFTVVDIEQVIACLRALGERDNLPTSPFVATWHDLIRDLGGPRKFKTVLEAVMGATERKLWLSEYDPDRLEYLNPLNQALQPNSEPISVFSLNYDNVFELWGKANHRNIERGFEGVFSGHLHFVDFDSIHLLKLHGSIDWLEAELTASQQTPFRWRTVKTFDPGGSEYKRIKTAILVGDGNKLSADGPFLDLFMEFERRLRTTTHLFVSGYSFRDHHVNTYIGRWLNSSGSNRVSVYNKPGDLFEEAFQLLGTEFEDAAAKDRVNAMKGGAKEAILDFSEAIMNE